MKRAARDTARSAGRAPVALAAFAACALLASAVLFVPILSAFCVYDAGNPGSTLLPDKPDLAAVPSLIAGARTAETGFVVSYTHSVNKGRVRDYCVLLPDGSVLVTKTRFVSYGAGMPEPEGSEAFAVDGEYLELRNINLRIPRLVLRVGVIANHEIECGGRVFALSDYFEPQSAVVIGRRKIPLIDYIRSNRMNAKE